MPRLSLAPPPPPPLPKAFLPSSRHVCLGLGLFPDLSQANALSFHDVTCFKKLSFWHPNDQLLDLKGFSVVFLIHTCPSSGAPSQQGNAPEGRASRGPWHMGLLANVSCIKVPSCNILFLCKQESCNSAFDKDINQVESVASYGRQLNTCQQPAPHVQVVMSAAPAGFTVEYSTPGISAIVHPV